MNKGIGLARFWLVLCSTLVLLPLLVVLTSFGEIDQEIWQFLLDYQLGLLLKNTLILLITTSVGILLLGVTTAWLTAMYQFPGRKLFFWAMMLPLTVPAYVLAFVQLGMFDYTGAMSTYL